MFELYEGYAVILKTEYVLPKVKSLNTCAV